VNIHWGSLLAGLLIGIAIYHVSRSRVSAG